MTKAMTPKNFPSASLSYAEQFTVNIDQSQLASIATTSFTTHRNGFAEKIHGASQFLLLPWRKSLQLIGRSFQSRPGSNKDEVSILRSRPLRLLIGILGFVFLIGSAAIALGTCVVHLAALLAYSSRPIMSYINNSKAASINLSKMSPESPLKIRSHNVGFVIEAMGIIGDLRPVAERAKELSANVLNDPLQPDIICFQEVFHEDGARILCDALKSQYPYILSGVLPTASGFNSGAMIASKYPILNASFHRLEHNLGIERLAPKGVLRIQIDTEKGPVTIYNAHTQPLLGKDRAEARYKQLEQIKGIMERDINQDKHPQVLLGDLNTSNISAWGENNLSENNPEARVQTKLYEEFEDIYLNDHDKNGIRTKDHEQLLFFKQDNTRMKLDESRLPEPSGSWYVGPFASSSTFIASRIMEHNKKDREAHHYKAESVKKIETPVSWGTKEWRNKQPADTARFDYVLFPKHKNSPNLLDGRAEIRRVHVPEDKQSAASDHLPVDAKIYYR